MNLGDIYQNNVNKKIIPNTGMSSSMPVSRERDPTQIKLEQDVFAKINDAVKKVEPAKQPIPKMEVKHYSLEDALKELRDICQS